MSEYSENMANQDMMTTFQTAKLLSVSPDTILKWCKSGIIKSHRTPGGHFRISKKNIENLLYEEKPFFCPSDSGHFNKPFQYCWEYNSKDGIIKIDCKDCLVYKTRAKRCYEMRYVPKELGHLKLFCTSSCEECDYYKLVKEQTYNILIITENKDLAVATDKKITDFNYKVTDCEYECSAFVEKFRPDFAIIDCSMNNARDFCEHFTNDPRIPYIRIIVASDTDKVSDFCDKKIIGRITKPFTLELIRDFIEKIS